MAAPDALDDHAPPAVPTRAGPQLTVRAVVTGMILGAVLAPSNIYAGLKIGWGFNMSITAALLSYGVWQGAGRALGARPFDIVENNINQTTASSGAMIASSGLVAAVPALTLLTGFEWSFGVLVLWTSCVSLLGVGVALVLRRQMLIVEKLPFPSGFATGETLREMYGRGSEALRRLAALMVGAAGGAASKVGIELTGWSRWALPASFPTAAGGTLAQQGITRVSLANLGFALDPSPLMAAVGAIIGFRAAASLLLGAVVAWGLLGPWALAEGWVHLDPAELDASASWFQPMVEWLLWPGVALMVTAALTSVAMSWRTVARAFRRAAEPMSDEDARGEARHGVPRGALVALLVFAALFALAMQIVLFDIAWWAAALGLLLTFVLAMVAARVTGETDITPIGAMGKVTQLFFGVVAPGGVTANLMAANVTGGAASQCADLLQDMRTGHMVGAAPRAQSIAQVFGVLSGALAGSAAYLLLIPDPQGMLFTEQWAAPAVATWKAVAEVFAEGVSAMPPKSVWAMAIGGAVGVLFTVLERTLPRRAGRFVPSAASVGLAMVIPAFYAISMFLGALVAVALKRGAPKWSGRFLLVLAAGVIAGESIVGVAFATVDAFRTLTGG
ncbi:MAG: OPT family oligopeptide transporter [Myxococcota bacterium]